MKRQKSVLLVMDQVRQACDFKEALEKLGVNLLWAATAEAGLQLARQAAPDLILLSLELPGVGGLAVGQTLKNDGQTRLIPLVILSEHATPMVLQAGIQLGAIDIIPRDVFAVSVLLATLRQLNMLEPAPGEVYADV